MARPSFYAAAEARWIAPLLLALTLSGCCGAAHERADAILDEVQTGALSYGGNASVLGVHRQTVEEMKEARELMALGDCAAEAAAERVGRGASSVSDDTAALCAFTIEQVRYAEGLEPLRAFLRSQPGLEGHVWSAHYAVRALLVLRGLPDPTGGYELYDEEAVRRALDGP